MPKNQYRFGRLKERKVAQRLRNTGASVKLSEGSKGPEDGTAIWPSGKKWLFQVKATREGSPSSPLPKDLGRLKQKATRKNATPVVAGVFGSGKIEFKSAGTGQKLKP